MAFAAALAAAALALPAGAGAHLDAHGGAPIRALALEPEGCSGAGIQPDRVIAGSFPSTRQGSYVMVPFEVPAGTTAVRVKYCYDDSDSLLASRVDHTLDLGLYDARDGEELWGAEEFRGWGGSSHPDVTVSPQGFSPEAAYLASPKGHVPGRTTRGFKPGPIPAGEWAVELGLAAIVPQLLGDSDGKVNWRVEIELSEDPSFDDEPYAPAPYDATPARTEPGWYAGDMHVHAEHSSLGDATMRETFGYAFAPYGTNGAQGAGLDFITLSDYVTNSAWGEIGRYQGDHPGKLIMRSSETITYRGHMNNHASGRYVDHRTGPVYELRANGTLAPLRSARPAKAIAADIHAGGGLAQINHPTIFPSKIPPLGLLCRGCSWDYTAAETDYRNVDAIEVSTGPAGLRQEPRPGPNPFTPLALAFYDDAIKAGGRIAAVGVSDSHHAGRPRDAVTQSPIGEATTVVRADELSEEGIKEGVRRRHTYVKLFGGRGPDLRFEARKPGSTDPPAIMGDVVSADRVDFSARVFGGTAALEPRLLLVVKDGVPVLVLPVTREDVTLRFPSLGPGAYRLQLQRGTAIEAVSSPIWVQK